MFDTGTPRVFGLPPGVDFAQSLVRGLTARLDGQPPEAMARVELYVNTTRMARRLRDVFDAGPPTFLPQIKLVTDLSDPVMSATLPVPHSPLRRRLELTGLVAKLLDAQPDIAPRSSLFDLSDSLATLMEEMQGENVAPQTIASLDVSDQSGHWQRSLEFLKIIQTYFEQDSTPDPQALQRIALEQRLNRWEEHPPEHPVIVAGSTGSRGTTYDFMRAVARLPQGAIVLPGFDRDLPSETWKLLIGQAEAEDHPQFRFARLMDDLGLNSDEIHPWSHCAPPAPERNKVFSLSLRPAPVTHQWLTEGPGLSDLQQSMRDVTLLNAPTQREEAMTIALRLRKAAEQNQRAALITPDRMLTRQVSAALENWGIMPDDSAGIPAQLTPPGRFMRHVATLLETDLTAETLLTLLKHPLCHSGSDRGPHLLWTRELELHIRRKGWPYPQPDAIRAWGEANKAADWANWVADRFCDTAIRQDQPLTYWVARHIDLAETIAAGANVQGSGDLWKENAGRAVSEIFEDLTREAPFGHTMGVRDYTSLASAILAKGEVRDRDKPHPLIRIWGTLEARVMDADLLILGGLIEGSWPESPAADPWLNRKMRSQAGLLLPERRVGLSAHDYQQAVGATEVWLSRSLKSADAETVPSRWLNRLLNMMNGLPSCAGPEAVQAMADRGAKWLALAQRCEAPIVTDRAKRPAPAPPPGARPSELPVTAIKHLIRDPYAIYARRILRLKPLDPLMRPPDALLRGVLIHEVLDKFVAETVSDPAKLDRDRFMHLAQQILTNPQNLPYPIPRVLWLARLNAVADWFVNTEKDRQILAHPARREVSGQSSIEQAGFTLKATADRIDMDDRAGAYLYDYKTGKAPTKSQQQHFDKQLLLEAAMLLRGGFKDIQPRHVARASFISLYPAKPEIVDAPFDSETPEEAWINFTKLILAYSEPDRGYSARRALHSETDRSDYDHLSRFGEWDITEMPVVEVLT